MPTSEFFLTLADAVSSSAGAAIATAATYSLELASTRLGTRCQNRQTQGSVVADEEAYGGGESPLSSDTLQTVREHEGGSSTQLFTGLAAATTRSAADSFLFFLFYSWIRSRRLHGGSGSGTSSSSLLSYLGAAEELAAGAAAAAFARLFITPIANAVARVPTEDLRSEPDPGSTDPKDRESTPTGWKSPVPPLGQVLADIRRRGKEVRGLWAGYPAVLVLAANPGITFFLQRMFTDVLAPLWGRIRNRDLDRGRHWGGDGPSISGTAPLFFLAAISKAMATAITYPFQVAKARVQISEDPVASSGDDEDLICMEDNEKTEVPLAGEDGSDAGSVGKETMFSAVERIGRDEGPRALYDGLGAEVFKASFSHGITMAAKHVVHMLLLRLYFAKKLAAVTNHRQSRAVR